MLQNHLSIPLGLTSTNAPVWGELPLLPHLFISHADEAHFGAYLTDTLKKFNSKRPDVIFATIGSGNVFLQSIQLLYGQPFYSHYAQPNSFIKSLAAEMQRRKKSPTTAPLVVVIENVFELVAAKQKKLPLLFLQLLKEGPAHHIHFIAASLFSYRNLVKQLINIHASAHPRLQQLTHDLYAPLGAELVITGENIYYYKTRFDSGYTRYFPASVSLCLERDSEIISVGSDSLVEYNSLL